MATHHRLFLALILAIFVSILYWASDSVHVFPKLTDVLNKPKQDLPVKNHSKLLSYEETPLLLNTTDTRTENASRFKTDKERRSSLSSVLRGTSVVSRHPRLNKTKKKPWVLPTVVKGTLILGDSNLCRITDPELIWIQIECFPGMRLEHTIKILKEYHSRNQSDQSRVQPSTVIMSVGINDRRTPTSEFKDLIESLLNSSHQAFPDARLYMPLVNANSNLSDSVIQTIESLNGILELGLKERTIPLYSSESFRTARDKIHWTEDCANGMVHHWLTYVKTHP